MVKVTAKLTESNSAAHCIICGELIPRGAKKLTIFGYQMQKTIGPECLHKMDVEINPIIAVHEKLFELALSKVNAMYKEKTGHELFLGDIVEAYFGMSPEEIAAMMLKEYRDIVINQ